MRENEQGETSMGPAVIEEQRAQEFLLLRADRATMEDLTKFYTKGSKADEVVEQGFITAIRPDVSWVIFFNALVRYILLFLRWPMMGFGLVLMLFLNEDSGLRRFTRSLLTGRRVVRDRRPKTYLSVVGHVDRRLGLQKLHTESESEILKILGAGRLQMDDQALMDLCVMASKVAYEEADVVQHTINKQWKMHFINFYNFWNEYRKKRSTQAFVMSDKQLDANVILICFRGVKPFDTYDLGVAFDFSWYHVPGLGKIHVGYLEALGLGTRDQISTIQSSFQGPDGVSENKEKEAAYFSLRNMLRSLLAEHPNAKFVVTGHSTGGALTALLPAILLFNEEKELINRWSASYTFGQPKIGDEQLGQFMQAHLDKYFRVVYGKDMVPELPDDDGMFYKHFGQRLYYNSLYVVKMEEEPTTDVLSLGNVLWEFLNAVRELVRGVLMQYVYGPEYKETWLLLFTRVLALVEPAVSAHCLTNYINCVRLGRRVHGTR